MNTDEIRELTERSGGAIPVELHEYAYSEQIEVIAFAGSLLDVGEYYESYSAAITQGDKLLNHYAKEPDKIIGQMIDETQYTIGELCDAYPHMLEVGCMYKVSGIYATHTDDESTAFFNLEWSKL